MKINNKYQYYTLASKKAFGNQTRIWKTPSKLLDSEYRGGITLRSLKPAGGCFPFNNVLESILGYKMLENPRQYIFQESVPDHLISIQGEVQQSDVFAPLYLEFCVKKGITLRQARSYPPYILDRSTTLSDEYLYHAGGLTALRILKSRLSSSSFEDLMALLEKYPGHVVEFTAFEIYVGDLKGRNCVVWEVRRY